MISTVTFTILPKAISSACRINTARSAHADRSGARPPRIDTSPPQAVSAAEASKSFCGTIGTVPRLRHHRTKKIVPHPPLPAESHAAIRPPRPGQCEKSGLPTVENTAGVPSQKARLACRPRKLDCSPRPLAAQWNRFVAPGHIPGSCKTGFRRESIPRGVSAGWPSSHSGQGHAHTPVKQIRLAHQYLSTFFHLLAHILPQAAVLGKGGCFNHKNFSFESTSLVLFGRLCYSIVKWWRKGGPLC